MRVYELSKELGISSKEILTFLKKTDFDAKSHMSVLSPEAIVVIQNHFKKTEPQAEDAKKIMQKESVKKRTSRFRSTRPKPTASKKINHDSSRVKKEQEAQKTAQYPEQMVIEPMTVADVSTIIGVPANDLILMLLRWGNAATINQMLPEKIVEKIADHYEITKKKVTPVIEAFEERVVAQGEGKLSSRLPVVVVLGHVDHGKTTLLDYIRKTRVVAKEKGGITQHLGAYEAKTAHDSLVFLDTPGHEAFPKMRQRGIKVADLGILVVAADDGIMPQTNEAIANLKKMNIPIVVAINKIDKAEASRIETVKRQLAEQDLLPEEWGGQTVIMPISALKGTGVNELLEMVALQAQLLELKATKEGQAKCYVLESKLEKGRGPVATLICQHGMLQVGDYFTCGNTFGRVSTIKNSYGKKVTTSEPSKPIQVAGFKELPEVGDHFMVVEKDDLRKLRSAQDQQKATFKQVAAEGSVNLIIKTDTNSSKEALIDAINKITKKSNMLFTIIHSGVGNVNESDVELAYSTGAMIVGLHTKADVKARALAKRRNVTFMLHDIIYKLLEELESQIEEHKEVEMVRTKVGDATVLKVFDIKGVGVVAGSYVQDGRFVKDGYVVGWRGRQKIGEGKILSLQREKKTVKEVHTGYECGFMVEGIDDWQVDDRAECYIDMPK